MARRAFVAFVYYVGSSAGHSQSHRLAGDQPVTHPAGIQGGVLWAPII